MKKYIIISIFIIVIVGICIFLVFKLKNNKDKFISLENMNKIEQIEINKRSKDVIEKVKIYDSKEEIKKIKNELLNIINVSQTVYTCNMSNYTVEEVEKWKYMVNIINNYPEMSIDIIINKNIYNYSIIIGTLNQKHYVIYQIENNVYVLKEVDDNSYNDLKSLMY